ncbi:unnamed protein product [Moneuplotes crassus]|uniref:TRP C-terminal domain-containing protein n=1 Tax=Euplotes crassus TaxID=5936 RepID=A0AAD1XQI9_EUPCR|nr:unnamed protein product [Moneuplotes crassus]
MLALISCFELYRFGIDDWNERTSFLISGVFVVCCCFFLIFCWLHAYKQKPQQLMENEKQQAEKMDELYTGLRRTKMRNFFPSIWLTRRLLFALFLCFMQWNTYIILIGIILSIQLFYLISLSILRPYEKLRVNFIEMINELFFTGYLCGLLIFTKEDWTDSLITMTLYTMLSNTIIIGIITFICLIDDIVKLLSKCCKRSSNQNQTVPVTDNLPHPPTTKKPPTANRYIHENRSSSNVILHLN